MGFFEVLGDAAKAVGGAIEDAAEWVGDRANDVGNWFDDLYHGNLGDQAVPAPDLVAKILASPGAQSWHQGAGQADKLAGRHDETGSRVQQLSAGLESAWTGGGADAAQARIKPFMDATATAAATYTGNGQNLTDLAHGFDSLKQSLQPIPGAPPHKNLWDEVTWWNTDTEDQINQYNKVVQENLDRYQGYSKHAKASGQGLKTDYGQLSAFDGDVTVSQPGTVRPREQHSHDSGSRHSVGPASTSGPGSTGGPSSAFAPGYTGSAAQAPGSSGHLPSYQPASYQPGAAGGSGAGVGSGAAAGDGTTASGWTPPDYGRTSGPGSGWVPSPSYQGGNGGGNSWSPGLVGGFGPNGGFGPTGGFGSGGAAQSGGAAAGRLGSGAGTGTEENAPGRTASAAGAGARGAAGARGGSGMGGMGAAGGKGKGEEDKEHQRKYGLEDDSAFDVTDDEDGRLRDPRTGLPPTPPTIGG
ncbi:PPE domain-containing protein [Amycolatopsis orientalis]|uniref:PPE domain-containing protein n=1 Tax=Amycolatopsis orientalis TaxID=31958 RepID=UPI00055FC961|nr:PPE domain-containing protein [Amycolatopsis orientalis]